MKVDSLGSKDILVALSRMKTFVIITLSHLKNVYDVTAYFIFSRVEARMPF